MRAFSQAMLAHLEVVGGLFSLLIEHKRWWLIPMVGILMVFGLLLILASTSGVGPLIYTLF